MVSLISILVLSFIYVRLIFSKIKSAVYYFIPYNYLFDLIFFSSDVNTSIISTTVRVLVVLIFFIRMNGPTFFNDSKPAFTLYLFISLILIFSSVFGETKIKSVLETVKFILILFSFFCFYVYFKHSKLEMHLFKRMLYSLLFITAFNILISNIFSFGWGGYGENVGFYTGGIVSNMWYIPAFTLLGAVAVLYGKNSGNLWFTVLAVLVFLILIVALRRSAYIVLFVSGLSGLIYLKLKIKALRVIILVGVILLSATPVFYPYLEKQLEARTKTFDKNVDEESRFKETEELWSERINYSSTAVLLFGEKPFNSVGNYAKGNFGDRPLHVDLNIVFYSSGLIGVLLYVLIFFSIFRAYIKTSRSLRVINTEIRIFRYLFIGSFVSLVALSFSGGLNAITYRMLAFMILGLSLGQLNYISTWVISKNKSSKPYNYLGNKNLTLRNEII